MSRRLVTHLKPLAALAVVVTIVSGAASTAYAAPDLRELNPAGGQRGTEVVVNFNGRRMNQGPLEILFERPGIEVTKIEAKEGGKAIAHFKIAADAPVGPRGVWIRSDQGMSNLKTFHVGALPEINEAGSHQTRETAQLIELGTCVNGVIDREQIDWFAFEAKRGERISVDVEAMRLGKNFFDPAANLYGPDGELLLHSDDETATYQDPSFSILAPADGRYLLALQEAALRGGNARYRLHLGNFPRPRSVTPRGAAAGAAVALSYVATDTELPADKQAALLEHAFKLPAADQVEQTPRPLYDWHAADDQGVCPTALPVRVSSLSVVSEVEPNSQRDKANPVELPIACEGTIANETDGDFYCFTAKKNANWDFTAYARQLRSPLDVVLRLFDAKGKRLASNDDNRRELDSYMRYRIPADGDYVLQVTDRLGRGGPDFVYRVEVTPLRPQVDLTAPVRRRFVATVANLPRGGQTALLVTARRRDMRGALRMHLDDLPAGVQAESALLNASYDRVPVLIKASPEAELAGSLAKLTAERPEAEADQPAFRSTFEQQTWLVRGRNNVPVWSHYGDRLAVAITEEAPFKLKLIPTKAPLTQRGTKLLRVVAERQEGFDEAISVKTLYDPPGVSSNRSRAIAKGKTEVTIPLTANTKARAGEWPICVVGQTRGQELVTATDIEPLKVTEPHLMAQLPTISSTQGSQVEYRIAMQRQSSIEGQVRFELRGLPAAASAEPVVLKDIQGETCEVVFKVNVDAKTPVGRHRSLACFVKLTDAGEEVQFTLGYGELRVDPSPSESPAEVADAATKNSERSES